MGQYTVQILSGESLLALVTTPSRLYVFLGGPGLTGSFSGYASRSVGAQTAPNLLPKSISVRSGHAQRYASGYKLGCPLMSSLSPADQFITKN